MHGFSAGKFTSGEGIWGWGMREGDSVFKKVEALLNLKFYKNGALYLFTSPPPNNRKSTEINLLLELSPFFGEAQ